ncbi:GLPGLI family protein [Chryseobacterium elymi]|uniref:GLPGLI family protein n=1 Tax=Chryseobacterium elymi TaxID=395936 RepID=A0A3D9DIW9_9FLAO|nr:GLPGLI family protein [Chryseobacterium elymi]REC77943.1 GLPGLI family protein [Chryseobacterium elymi]
MECKTFLRIVLIFLAMCSNNKLHAQKYRALYSMQFKADSTATGLTTKDMLLDIDGGISRFYSYKLFKSDSTFISNEKLGREAIHKSMDYEFMTIKNKTQGQISKFYRLLIDVYELKEAMPLLSWKITSDTKMVNNNKYQKALLDYKGRKWEAWFAVDIPISEGPSVFNGLPGLIVSISDSKGNYSFNLLELKKKEENIYTSNNLSVKTIPVNLQQLHKLYLDHYNDPYREIKSGYIKAKFVDQSGKEITPNFNEQTKNKQIILKQTNNPIELSEAVQYP